MMEPISLDEIGALLLEAARKLSAEDRERVGELLLENLRKPVGGV